MVENTIIQLIWILIILFTMVVALWIANHFWIKSGDMGITNLPSYTKEIPKIENKKKSLKEIEKNLDALQDRCYKQSKPPSKKPFSNHVDDEEDTEK